MGDSMNKVSTSKILIFTIAQFILSCYAIALPTDEYPGLKKYYGYSPEAILALPKSVRESEIPMAYSLAANTARAEWGKDVLAASLNILMYTGIGNYEAAVKSFQKDLGDEITGKLNVGQIYELQYRADMQSASPPFIAGEHFAAKHGDYAIVDGTLQLLDERAAYPVNKVKIRCARQTGYCTLDEVDLVFPARHDFSASFKIYWTDPTEYKITKWSDDVIEAEFETSGEQCRTTKLELNFKTKEYFMITKNAGPECEILGQKLEKLKRPRISQIVNGEEIIQTEDNAFQKTKSKMISSEFRARIEELSKKEQAAQKTDK